jgi:hypothetical protein
MSEADYIASMTVVLVLALIAAGIWLTAQRAEKPSELDPDCWDTDPAVRAANVAAKTVALRDGKGWLSPKELARLEAARTRPWPAEGFRSVVPPEPERRLVRDHPMRPARWK